MICPVTNMWRGFNRALVRRFPIFVGVSLVALPAFASTATRQAAVRFGAFICTISAAVGALMVAICEVFH